MSIEDFEETVKIKLERFDIDRSVDSFLNSPVKPKKTETKK